MTSKPVLPATLRRQPLMVGEAKTRALALLADRSRLDRLRVLLADKCPDAGCWLQASRCRYHTDQLIDEAAHAIVEYAQTLQSSADLRCLACREVPGVHAIGCPLDPTEGNAR